MLEAATDKIKAYKAYFYDRGPSFLSQDASCLSKENYKEYPQVQRSLTQGDYKMTYVQTLKDNYLSNKISEGKKTISPI